MAPTTTEAIDRLLEEDRLTLNALAKEERVKQSTPWRWATIGVKGIKLETVKVGGRMMTSRQAFQRFVRALNGVSAVDSDSRKKSIARAEKILAKAGI